MNFACTVAALRLDTQSLCCLPTANTACSLWYSENCELFLQTT